MNYKENSEVIMFSKDVVNVKDNTLHSNNPDFYMKNGLEGEVDRYKDAAIEKVKFSLVIKPAIISFLALILSFFLDLAYVPLLGNISIKIAKTLFPTWTPVEEAITPYSFWWLPVVVYAFFIFMAFMAYNKLKAEITRSPASETIDRIITSYTSIIDSISTALPLIGAALLLISIKLGEEIFLGLSVPFEIKALIILAIGKLFEPVLDQLGVEFQNIVTHVKDIRDKYFSKIQIENSKNLIQQISNKSGMSIEKEFSVKDMEVYKTLLEQTYGLSTALAKNFASINELIKDITKVNTFDNEKIAQLNQLALSISAASKSLSDDKTLVGLKSLESIVVRK